MVAPACRKDGLCTVMLETRQPLTLEQEANFLYLADHYPCVVVLLDNAMYGAECFADAARLILAERELKLEEQHEH